MRIFGVGNGDCGDDAAGLLAARRLRALGWDAVEIAGSPLELLEAWEGVDDVVIIDATSTGGEPGSVTWWNVSERPLSLVRVSPSAHAFGLGETLELARALGRLPRRTWVCAIEGAGFGAGTAPCEAVLAAIETQIQIPEQFTANLTLDSIAADIPQ